MNYVHSKKYNSLHLTSIYSKQPTYTTLPVDTVLYKGSFFLV